jgi:hypothetical protein
MSAPAELFMMTLTDSLDRLVAEPFNPDDPRHAALFDLLDDDCPECRAARHRLRKDRAEGRRLD